MTRSRRATARGAFGSLALAFALTTTTTAFDGNVDLPRFPAVSPDGSQVVFSWRGDLWRAPTAGGSAVRLTSHPGNDTISAWSPDGALIAFTSDRTGDANVHVMNADGTDLRQLTNIDRPCTVSGFGTDDAGDDVVLFSGVLEGDVYRDERPYMVSLDGGDLRRVHDAFGSEPRTSADGAHVVFTRGGYYDGWERRHYRGPENADVWRYDRADGSFHRLTTFDGNDGKARWGGPGTLLFLSDREDRCVNLYHMSATDGADTIARVTDYTERDVRDFDVSADGTTAVLMVWDTLHRLDLTDPNATPQPIEIVASEDERDRYELLEVDRRVSEAALSPDGKVMAIVSYGEVYVRALEDDAPTVRVTRDHAREKDLAWSPDGERLYFTSDRDGTESIYAATVTLTRGDLRTEFEEATGRELLDAEDVGGDDEKKKPEEKDDDAKDAGDDPVSGTWSGTADVPDMGPSPYSITLELADDGSVSGSFDAGPYSGPVSGTFDRASGRLEFTVTTADGAVIAFDVTVADGVMTGTAGADGLEVAIEATRGGGAGGDDDEGDDDKDDAGASRWHDALRFEITPVVVRATNDREASPSPDGRTLAFRSTRGNVDLLDLESGAITPFLEGWDAETHWRWSPDSTLIAYARSDMDFNSDIFIAPVDGSWDAINITKHPDNDTQPRWSADGKVLAFISERVYDEADVWSVYLDEALEALTPREREAYFEARAKAAKKRKPLKKDDKADEDTDENEDEDAAEDAPASSIADDLELDTAYLRVRRLTRLEGGEGNLEMTPGGDRIVFTAGGDVSGLHSIKYDGTDRKQLGGNASVQHVSLTGDKVILVSGRRAAHVAPGGGSVDFVNIDDQIEIDLEAQSRQKFLEAARGLGEGYYHPTMNGTDWPALTEAYLDLARRARTAEEFNWVANRFIGELNGSHLAIRASDPGSPNRRAHGRIGTVHRRVANGFEVTATIPDSPAATGPMALEPGDVITEVDFEPFDDDETLEVALQGRVGQETAFTIERAGATFRVFFTPISYNAYRQLCYDAWRLENARLVSEWSDGRLGYIHIQSMGQPALDVFERDLFAAAEGRDGLVIDVRNNGGGWTTDRVLSSIMVQPHAYTIPRGADAEDTGHYPQPRLFIQRYTLPMNLLCNEKSYSNAEIMSHAFKNLDRGTLVGQQTHGSVISTGGWSLIDGTFVRLPFRGWFVMNGTDMELNGAMPDLVVEQTPEDETRGEDAQLRAAVEDLLGRLE